MESFFKKVSITSIITSIIFIILGVVMLIKPAETTQMLALILGITMMAIGIEKIISYFALKGNRDFYNYELVYGIIGIILSIMLLTNVNTFTSIVRIAIGAWITYAGLMKMLYAFKVQQLGIKSWTTLLVIAILTVIAGAYIICVKDTVIMVFAVLLIGYAVMDIIDQVIFMKNIEALSK